MITKVQDILVPNNLDNSDNEHLYYYNIQSLPIRYLYIKIEIIDKDSKGQDIVINEVSGTAIDGSYNISVDSIIRRTCNLSFNLENGYIPNEQSPFWINKRFRLFIGLKNIEGTKIYWFNKGVYAINDPEINIAINDKTISINGLDKMALYTGDITGQLLSATLATVESGVTIENAVDSIMRSVGENQIKLVDTDKKQLQVVIPYDIESNIGDYVSNVLDKLLELIANYQYYYDLDGNFVFAPKPMNNNFDEFPIEWDFEKYNNLIISINRNISYSNVKNRITVWGGVHDDGYQPSYTQILNEDNENFRNSPFTVEKLNEFYPNGSVMYRDYVEQDDDYVDTIWKYNRGKFKYYPKGSCIEYDYKGNNGHQNAYGRIKAYWFNNTDKTLTDRDKYPPQPPSSTDYSNWEYICDVGTLTDITDKANNGDTEAQQTFQEYMKKIHAYSIELCKLKTDELMFYHNFASDTVTITCVPIYSLDVNTVINLNDKKSGAIGKYVVQEISCNLGTNGTMTIKANKLF
nr:MAG TPA: protein of unknown function (DUF5047) [Caudoviricetes sp.]